MQMENLCGNVVVYEYLWCIYIPIYFSSFALQNRSSKLSEYKNI